jgi:hypothetical protein
MASENYSRIFNYFFPTLPGSYQLWFQVKPRMHLASRKSLVLLAVRVALPDELLFAVEKGRVLGFGVVPPIHGQFA